MGVNGSVEKKPSVYVMSDIHTDEAGNMELLRTLNRDDFTPYDILILAGDVSANLRVLEETLTFLKQIFSEVFFVPGNNELRLEREVRNQEGGPSTDSVEKFDMVRKLCQDIGVITHPRYVHGVWIVPLFGWYTAGFEPGYDGNEEYKRGWYDFRACRWPAALTADADGVANHFLALNDVAINEMNETEEARKHRGEPIITFSHFLPRRDLLPWMAVKLKPTFPYVVGCTGLDRQLRAIGSTMHIYGHTHIDGDTTIDGVRYIQHPLGHVTERNAWWKPKTPYQPMRVFELPITPEDIQGE